jgi:hypothetical protein
MAVFRAPTVDPPSVVILPSGDTDLLTERNIQRADYPRVGREQAEIAPGSVGGSDKEIRRRRVGSVSRSSLLRSEQSRATSSPMFAIRRRFRSPQAWASSPSSI